MHIHRSAPPMCSGHPIDRIRRLSTHADCTPLMTSRTDASETRRTHVHTPARSEGWRRLAEPWEPRGMGRAQAIKQLNRFRPRLKLPHGRPTPCLWLRANVHGGLSRSIENTRIGREQALGALTEFEPVLDVRRCSRTPGATTRVSAHGSMNAGESSKASGRAERFGKAAPEGVPLRWTRSAQTIDGWITDQRTWTIGTASHFRRHESSSAIAGSRHGRRGGIKTDWVDGQRCWDTRVGRGRAGSGPQWKGGGRCARITRTMDARVCTCVGGPATRWRAREGRRRTGGRRGRGARWRAARAAGRG